jgi:precorrin-3B synthase
VTTTPTRTRRDLCPGVFRPWPADDGNLLRLRLPGGKVPAAALAALSGVARAYGDGDLHLTGRANLQLRGLATVSSEVVAAIVATGLLPSRTHELVRNLMASPQTGRAGGRADLRPVVAELDRLLCADPALAELPGRFLFLLDDGRGDLVGRPADLGLVALDERIAQLRVGAGWGPVVSLAEAPGELARLARRFLAVRGVGTDAPWHVDELPAPLLEPTPRDPRTGVSSPPLRYGDVPGGVHVEAPGGVLAPDLVRRLVERARGCDLVVTPWRGVLVPDPAR